MSTSLGLENGARRSTKSTSSSAGELRKKPGHGAIHPDAVRVEHDGVGRIAYAVTISIEPFIPVPIVSTPIIIQGAGVGANQYFNSVAHETVVMQHMSREEGAILRWQGLHPQTSAEVANCGPGVKAGARLDKKYSAACFAYKCRDLGIGNRVSVCHVFGADTGQGDISIMVRYT